MELGKWNFVISNFTQNDSIYKERIYTHADILHQTFPKTMELLYTEICQTTHSLEITQACELDGSLCL